MGLSSNVRLGDVFVDVGAHLGVYSLAAARMVGPSGTVIAIEPDPLTFERLRATVTENGLGDFITIVNAGASDRRERLRLGLNVFGNRGGSSFIHHPDFPGREVDCEPLHEILEEHGVVRVRAAKLDIEGLEHRVLSTYLRDAPSETWPDLLIVECAELPIAGAGDAAALLMSYGYREHLRAGQNRAFVRR